MIFTEKELLKAFKENVDNKGWIYFVGNPESNAKFIIDYIKEHRENIFEEELDKLAAQYADNAPMTGECYDGYGTSCFDYTDIKNAYKEGCKEILKRP